MRSAVQAAHASAAVPHPAATPRHGLVDSRHSGEDAVRPAALGFSAAIQMTLRRLRTFTWLGLVLFIAIVQITRTMISPRLDSVWADVMLNLVIVAGAVLFFGVVFQVIDRMQDEVRQRNQELEALHAVGLDIHAELGLHALLQKVVDDAKNLLGARYGALSVVAENGRIESFITSGIDEETRRRIGPPPRGHGVLAVVLDEGQSLRMPDVTQHPRSQGFPAHHPPMKSLLAVPIPSSSDFRGNLYLADKIGADEFGLEDEAVLGRFASMAAIAIQNARLHEQTRTLAAAEERLRIAHEMHDGLAQVLAYVNTKAQAVTEFLRQGRTDQAEQQLQQLAGAAREVYADTRESILNLRASASGDIGLSAALLGYLQKWEDQSGVTCVPQVDETITLHPGVELQVLRIAQEALSNVRKHSGATRAVVEARHQEGLFRLRVEDDGAGFDPELQRRGESPRFGLTTMRERAATIGATLRITTVPGSGTRVELDLPAPSNDSQGDAHASAHR